MTDQCHRVAKVQARRVDYTNYAKGYDERRFAGQQQSYYEWLRFRALSRALRQISRSATVLDVGCGTGRGLISLQKLGFRSVIGLDFTEDMLHQAVGKARTSELTVARLVRGDAFSLPFVDGQFDVVTSFNFLHMFEFPLQNDLIREMRRVARQVIVVELESIHKGLVVSRYPEQHRLRNRTKFNSYSEVSRLFSRKDFGSYRVFGSVLPLLHRWLVRTPSVGALIDSIGALPLVAWLASRIFVVGVLPARQGGRHARVRRQDEG